MVEQQSVSAKKDQSAGFTIIEVLITIFLIGTVITGLFGLFVLNLRAAQEGERRVAAIALANERMEVIRNLPYVNIGTDGGVPSGTIPQTEEVVRNGVTHTVVTDIRYIDDPYDNTETGGNQVTICHYPPGGGDPVTLTVGAPAVDAHLAHGDTMGPCSGSSVPGTDDYNTDYKQVRVQVSWPSPNNAAPITLISQFVPQGIEGGETSGTLDFQALDAAGAGIEGASLHLVNDSTNPTIDITTFTNEEGRVVLPGLPTSSDSYEIDVTKSGFTVEQTYDATATFIPDADHSHLSMIIQEITYKTFFIDQVAEVDVITQDETSTAIGNVAFTFQGVKTIGEDDLANPVLKTDISDQTGASGSVTLSDLEWDLFTIAFDGLATGYDIKETDPPTPLAINPADDIDLTVTLVPHTPISLQVTVTDETGNPLNNATAQLTGNGHDETLGTGVLGQVYFGDLPSNADYTIDLDAPGYQAIQNTVTVQDTTRAIFDLAVE